MSQLGPFEVGQIKAHLHDGLTGADILRILKKPDGKTGWSPQVVYNAIDTHMDIVDLIIGSLHCF
jgi:hypothetical protein